MRMLESKDDENDVEVTWEDQQRINTFSKLNARVGDLEEALELKKVRPWTRPLDNPPLMISSSQEEKDALDDLATELELADEDEPVLYKVGDAFVHIPLSVAQTRLQQDQEGLEKDMSSLRDRIDECETTMKELKVVLYGKFGKAINLDV
ncbi:hypothetical protein FRB90_008597 [Tulasnella sp. 427]|nr:hypothetical protein FRB90_008597 [Tulasnella sp. 427]